MNARIAQALAFTLMAGCGGGGGGNGGPPEMPSAYLYANAYAGPNAFVTDTFGFAVYPSGALSPIPGFSRAPAAAYGGGPLAITRDSKLLYSTDELGINAFQIKPDGTLTSASPRFEMSAQLGLAVHPTADFLYASSSSGVLSVLAIGSGTGALSLTSSVSLGSNIEVGVSAAITPDGRFLYQADANFPNGVGQSPALLQVAGFSIDSATGALTAVPGSPVSPMIQTASPIVYAPHPAMAAIDASGKFLYVTYATTVTAGSDGGVAAYSIDANSGALARVPGSPFILGVAPDSVAIDASGRFLIVSVPPQTPGNCLDVLSIDPGTGALALVPGSPFGPCGFVAADASGPFLYVGGGSQTGPAIVSVLSVDQTNGALTRIDAAAVPAGEKLGVNFIAVTH